MKIAVFLRWFDVVEKHTYIFIDIEAAFINGKQHIIEIGAIKLLPNERIEPFSQIIKPSNFTKLSTHIQKLTGITNEEVMEGKSFPVVINEFISWCGENAIFITYGNFDRRILEIELKRNNINSAFMYPIVDFQQKYMIEHNIKNQPSLLNLLTQFNISIEIQHRALNDAYSLMKLFEVLKGEELIKKQQTNDFILLLAEMKQHEDECECILTYVSGSVSTKLTIQSVQTIKKGLPIEVIEDENEENVKQVIQPNTEIAKFLQTIIPKMENKVLITRTNMKTISKICRIHQCTLPKTEFVPLQMVLNDSENVSQFLINNLTIKKYEQKVCQLLIQYSNNIKEEFSKRHLFKKDKITL